MNEYSISALGVAHQALEEINPSGDNILIQGKRWRLQQDAVYSVTHVVVLQDVAQLDCLVLALQRQWEQQKCKYWIP